MSLLYLFYQKKDTVSSVFLFWLENQGVIWLIDVP